MILEYLKGEKLEKREWMKLYHWTDKRNLLSILQNGLKPNGIGIVYLTPSPDKWQGEICLQIETGELKLTAFDDCSDWEVLCWGDIYHPKILF